MQKYTFTLIAALLGMMLSASAYAEKEFYGTIESKPNDNIGTWVISGQQVQVTDKTELEDDHGPLAVGTCVEVEHKNGMAKEIESAKTEKCTKRDKTM